MILKKKKTTEKTQQKKGKNGENHEIVMCLFTALWIKHCKNVIFFFYIQI